MRYILFVLFLILSWVVPSEASPRYVFLFIGDGLGQEEIDLFIETAQRPAFVEFPVHVLLKTHTQDGRVPDSAASATSIACGIKVREGILAQDDWGRPIKTIAEKAKERGYRVGIITNVALNDATPAAFYAHTDSRRRYDDIAWQMVQSGFDLFVGGGMVSSSKEEQDNVLNSARKRGYVVIRSFEEFLALKATPVIALLPFVFAIDRKTAHPTLAQCVRKAIELLSNSSGFFLIVEGGRIDWCNHMNDLLSSLQELEDFNAAIWEALLFGRKHSQETLILVTADHETGGLRWERTTQVVLPSQRGSYDFFFTELRSTPRKEEALWEFLTSFWEGQNEETVTRALRDFCVSGDEKALWISLARSIAEEIGVVWTTLGHTAASVPLYAWGKGADCFTSASDNTDIAQILGAIFTGKIVPEKVF